MQAILSFPAGNWKAILRIGARSLPESTPSISAFNRSARWHPSGMRGFGGWVIPGWSLCSTPGYYLSSLRDGDVVWVVAPVVMLFLRTS